MPRDIRRGAKRDIPPITAGECGKESVKHIGIVVALFSAATLFAQHRLTVEEIYDPANANTFSATPQKGFQWIDDDHFLWPRRNAAGDVVANVVVDARTGRDVAMFDSADLQAQVRRIEGVSEGVKTLSRPSSPELPPKHDSLLLTAGRRDTCTSTRSPPGL